MSNTQSTSPSKPRLLWTNVLVFSITFLVAAIGVPLYAYNVGLGVEHLVATTLALGFAGMSITVGYHRLWSHRTYEAHPFVQFFLALGGAFALQNSALHWSSDHRIHHKFVDQNDKDPYSAKRGFWFSHIGWMLRDYQSERYEDYSNCRDLQKNKIVMWQHKYYLPLALATNFGIPLLLGIIFNDIWGMLLTVGVLRLVLSHHFTFFINSLAHIWGSQPYTDKNTARDNFFLSLVTYGEGYHNYHHIFENDYRNGIRWYHFDPSKWFIKSMNWLGLTKNLRVVPEEKIKAAKWRMQKQKTEQQLIHLPTKKEVLDKLEKEYDQLLATFKEFIETKKAYFAALEQTAKKQRVSDKALAELKANYEQFKAQWQMQQKQWQRFLVQVNA